MIGVVADDVTGANDIGLMFAKHGYKTEVFSSFTEIDLGQVRADVLILDTNSRCDNPALAYDKVIKATQRLTACNCRILMKKTCSVFRGNIGAEFDAMLDAAGADFAVVVAAFPKNGRITKGGHHFVHGLPLVESEFRKDPVHPMQSGDLREIIAQQSRRPSHLLDYQAVAQGIAEIKRRIDEAKKKGGYLVCDVTGQNDLKLIAEAAAAEPFLFGSSALAEELPPFWPGPEVGLSLGDLPRDGVGSLIIAGSVTPQTKAQVAYARQMGLATAELDTRLLFQGTTRDAEFRRVVSWAVNGLQSDQPVLVYGAHKSEDIEATYRAAEQAGLNKLETNHIVSRTLGEISRAIVEQTVVKKLIVAGGETSGDVCRSLGIVGNLVLKEIQPGLPSGLSRGSHELLVVLKSGSFGSPDFFIQALAHLETL